MNLHCTAAARPSVPQRGCGADRPGRSAGLRRWSIPRRRARSCWSAITPAARCRAPWARWAWTMTALSRHIAWDIGAAELTRRLADRLDAPAVLAGYSRLVIDLNRQPGDPQSILEVSDGVVIPGNVGLDAEAAGGARRSLPLALPPRRRSGVRPAAPRRAGAAVLLGPHLHAVARRRGPALGPGRAVEPRSAHRRAADRDPARTRRPAGRRQPALLRQGHRLHAQPARRRRPASPTAPSRCARITARAPPASTASPIFSPTLWSASWRCRTCTASSSSDAGTARTDA